MGHDQRLRVWRGDAGGGDFASYSVPVEEGEVILDAIHRLQAEQAPDLAVRWNCKAGKCGSCSAEINGKPRLMCMTRLSTFDPDETITVTPMRTFPVIRDLVTDVTFNYEKAREVPAFTPAGDNKGGKFRMQQVDVERGQEFRKCIECFLCQDTCHVIRDHEENKPAFAGPRFFIRYAELDMHPLDTLDRRQMAQHDEGLGYCNITKCCTEVCPEHIKITDNGIIPLKERVVDTKYDPVFIGLRIGRRKDRHVVGPAAGTGPSPIKRPGGPPTLRPEPAIAATGTLAPAPPRTPGAADKVASGAMSALPAVGAAAGVGFLAWAIRRARKK
jgi:succinate dehydrogenase / fumarate reductase iron-sulfur subunit